MKDFFCPQSKKYLQQHYVKLGKSTYVIAAEQGTYANLIRRALIHHGIPLRSKAQAQKIALKSGRHPHPTRKQQQTIA